MSPTTTTHNDMAAPTGRHDEPRDGTAQVAPRRAGSLSMFSRRRRQPDAEEFIDIEDRLASF